MVTQMVRSPEAYWQGTSLGIALLLRCPPEPTPGERGLVRPPLVKVFGEAAQPCAVPLGGASSVNLGPHRPSHGPSCPEFHGGLLRKMGFGCQPREKRDVKMETAAPPKPRSSAAPPRRSPATM